MARVFGLCILALLGFYVAWPAYSAFAIKSAFDNANADKLATKVDFDQVRSSLKPAVSTEVEKVMTAAIQQGGNDNAQLLTQLKVGVMPNVIEMALATIVTPESLLRIYREGGDAKKTITKIVSEKMGSSGLGALAGLAGGKVNGGGGLSDIFKTIGRAAVSGETPGATPVDPAASPAPAAVGIGNIKSFAVTGPLSFSVGVAKSAASALADVTVDMGFTGFDWKVVGVRPRV